MTCEKSISVMKPREIPAAFLPFAWEKANKEKSRVWYILPDASETL